LSRSIIIPIIIITIIIINEVKIIVSVMTNNLGHFTKLMVKTMERNETQPDKVNVTELVQKARSSGGSITAEVMAHP